MLFENKPLNDRKQEQKCAVDDDSIEDVSRKIKPLKLELH